MENEERINWLSLFIKIVIIFIFALIIIWLISKIIGKFKPSETFTNNINKMEQVSVEYFKTIDLPLEKGKSIKVTLGELIEKELIVSVNSDSDSSCDTNASYSEITREKKKYVVSTTLKCGKEKDTIKTDFSLKDCKNCNPNTNTDNSETDKETNNESSDNTNSTSGVTYYEYVKETTSYTKWMRGSLTGNNIENKYEYYGIDYDTYYTLGVIPTNKTSITYTLKLNSVPNSKYYFTTIEKVNNFDISEKDNYSNEKDISVYKGDKTQIPTSNIEEYSLRESNFTYKLSPYYRKGSFYINVTIKINNTTDVKSYYDSKLKENAYLIPLKVKVKFASDVIGTTKPSGEYETISYYRYVTVDRQTTWSTETNLEGYTKTGKTEIR